MYAYICIDAHPGGPGPEAKARKHAAKDGRAHLRGPNLGLSLYPGVIGPEATLARWDDMQAEYIEPLERGACVPLVSLERHHRVALW